MLKVILMLQHLKIDGRLLNFIVKNFTLEETENLFDGGVLDLQFKYNVFSNEHLEIFYNREQLKITRNFALKIIKESADQGIRITSFYDEEYPDSLRDIKNSPRIIYSKGQLELLKSEKAIGCVGTREPSDYMNEVVCQTVKELSKNQVVIVSGLAQGIDTLSHKSALAHETKTIAVLANGLNTIYPRENSDLANEILTNNGLIISEYPINSKINKSNFVDRNRIVSGLSNAVIVFEASEKSGTMHTARFALSQGKKIFCPNLTELNLLSSGVKKLVETSNAELFIEPSEILEHLYDDKLEEIKLSLNKKEYKMLKDVAIKEGKTLEDLLRLSLSKYIKGEIEL